MSQGDGSSKAQGLAENDLDHDLLKRKLGDKAVSVEALFGQTVILCERENLVGLLTVLRDDEELAFRMLTDVTAVDNMRRPDFEPSKRFTVVHILYSVVHAKRVRVETYVPETEPAIPSASDVYLGAGWIEREVFDMFGIIFTGHPDLRRVLTPDYFTEHPLRKDYPLTGRGERDNFVRAEEIS